MSFTIQGGSILPAQQKLTTTNPTVIVDGKQSGATVIAIYATEISGNTPALTLEKYDTETTERVYLRNAKPMTAREEYTRDVIVVLKAGEQLRATASAANQIDVLATYIPGERQVS